MTFVSDYMCHAMDAYAECLYKAKWCMAKPFVALFAAVSNRTSVVHLAIDRVVLHTLLLTLSNVMDPDNMVRYHVCV